MGRHTFNFAEAANLAEESGAALRVPDMRAAVVAAIELAQDSAQRQAMQAAAQQLIASSQGAARRTAQAVLLHIH